MRFGSAPTLSAYDCRPYENGNDETCTLANPIAGRAYVFLHGYAPSLNIVNWGYIPESLIAFAERACRRCPLFVAAARGMPQW